MRILVFTEGTVLMQGCAAGLSREEVVRQVKDSTMGVKDFSSYIPVGAAVSKLERWHEQGAEIMYLTSRTAPDEIADIAEVLRRHRFPNGRLYHRLKGEEYHAVAERVKPDILIEDDCESIGGEREMTSYKLDQKAKIRAIIVKEFGGIDHLPDEMEGLRKRAAFTHTSSC